MGRLQDLALLARRLDIAAGHLVDHLRTKRRGEARPLDVTPPAASAPGPEFKATSGQGSIRLTYATSPDGLALQTQIADHCRMLDAAGDLDALRVVEHIARRAVLGCKQYGPLKLATDKRDWRQEAREEAADGLFYMACLALERKP